MKRLGAVAIAVFTAAIIIGCGDSRLSKAEVIKKGDDICTKNNSSELEKKLKSFDFSKVGSVEEALKQLAPLVKEGAQALKKTANDFDNLKPPKSDESKIKSLASQLRGLSTDAASFSDAAAKGDLAKISSLGDTIGKKADTVEKAARDYGFKVCGKQT